MRIDSSGNVGIGTASPSALLEVAGSSNSTYLIAGGDDSSNGRGLTFTSSASAAFNGAVHTINAPSSQGVIALSTYSTERMRITSSGNVGIGTTSPDAMLRIDQDNVATGLKVTGGNGGVPLAEFTRDIGGTGTVEINANGGDPQIKFASEGNTFSVGVNSNTFEIADNATLGTNARFAINSTGKVGIGTTSPQGDRLSVVGSDLSNDDDLITLGGTFTASTEFLASIGTHHSDVNNGGIKFSTKQSGTVAERLRIDSSGNLLVGKTVADVGTAGTCLRGSVSSIFTVSGSVDTQVAIFNRTSLDGTILDFRKDGTTVGSIGTVDGDIVIGTGTCGVRFHDGTPAIQPRNSNGTANNDAIDIGLTGNRFKDLYLSGGVYLGGTGAANKLDDYEEGTWTPVLSDGTNNATSSVAEGTYTKVGRQVTLSGRFALSSLGSVSGSTRITGLPFTVYNGNAGRGSLNVSYAANLNLTAGYTVIGSPAPGLTIIYLGVWDIASGTTDLQASEMTATSTLFFSATYFV
jgi:hypothetical protein